MVEYSNDWTTNLDVLIDDVTFTLTHAEYSKLVHSFALDLECRNEKRPEWLWAHIKKLGHAKGKYPCCANEKRNMSGWCENCGDPCF